MPEITDIIKKAIRSGPVPKIRDWRKISDINKLTRAERAMAFIEQYCKVPEGALIGQPIKLALFQEAFFYSVYDNPHNTTDAYLSIARKNSKTATIACLVLVHLVGPEALPNTEIASGARSREQAAQVFRYAQKMVGLNKDLQKIIRVIPSKKTLIGLNRNVEYHALSAEASTTHGGSPVVAILDEVGQVKGPRDDFIDAVITSQGAHENPLLIAISTQAPTEADLFSVWLDDAAKGEDPAIISHVYEADKECDLTDEKQWQQANPALGLFRGYRDLKKQITRAVRMPSGENTVRNLCLNQRVSLVDPFVSKSIWDQNNEAPQDEIDSATICYAGLDLSGKNDLTALVVIQWINGKWDIYPFFWTPENGLRDRAKRDRVPYDLWAREGWLRTTPGATVDYEFIAQEMAEIFESLQVGAIAFDRWRIDLLKKELEKLNVELPLVPFGQGYKDSAPAVDTLEGDLINGVMRHGGHPVLTMCAANTVTSKDGAGNRKFDKAKAYGRIDGMAALLMARGVLSHIEEETPASPWEDPEYKMTG